MKSDRLLLDSNPVFISDQYAANSENGKLFPDDILITMTGTREKKDYLFSVLLSENDFVSKRLYLNQRVGCLRISSLASKQFIVQILKSESVREPIFRSATGSANQANIGMVALRNTLVPFPPLSEQERIVVKVNELMMDCDRLESMVKNSTEDSERLWESILGKVFNP